jgi:phosphate transport system ATP-binding protein
VADPTPHIVFDDVTVHVGGRLVLDRIDLEFPRRRIAGIIGPANSGKTTLLKCINRMIDLVPRARVQGRVLIDGLDVLRVKDVQGLRRRIGMVLPLPVGLPLCVYDNVALAPRLSGIHARADLDARVERCLRQAALWDEVKDRLGATATTLSGGQQQRLAIARALSHDPEILCLDEFSIAVDPVTTMRIEDVLLELRDRLTIVVATNLVQQAHRLADEVVFLNAARLVEAGPADRLFSEHPASRTTFEYVRGHFG